MTSSCVYTYREEQLTLLQSGEEYDVLVIGGGATGVGVALDASTRGTYSYFTISCPNCTMHVTIVHVNMVLERQSLSCDF